MDSEFTNRFIELCDKVRAHGPESLAPEEQAELQEMAAVIVEVFQQFAQVLSEFAQQVVEGFSKAFSEMWESLPSESRELLLKLSSASDESAASPMIKGYGMLPTHLPIAMQPKVPGFTINDEPLDRMVRRTGDYT